MDRNMLLNFHKVKPPTFGNIQKKREVESNRLKNDRHARRTDRYNSRRNMGNEEDSKLNLIREVPKKNPAVEASKVLDRKLALQKFKREKEALQKASKKNVRPPFKVGIPHHGSSPLLRDLTNHDCLTNKHRPVNQEVRPQRVTRAMSKATNVPKENNLPIRTKNKPILKVAKDIKSFPFKEPKSVFTFKPKKVESVKKLTSPHTPTVLKRSAKKNPTLLTNPSRRNVVIKSSFNNSTSSTSSGYMLAVPLPEVETNAVSPVQKEEQLSPPSLKQTITTQAASNEKIEFVLSPHVETQQGKRLGWKRTPSAEFHRNRLDDETRRLLSLAELWEPVALQPKIPHEVVDEIDSLVGQTRLLTRDKFNQFRGLVDQFESGATTAASVHPVTLDDLDGFWEMMYLQVEPLIKRYDELEILKNNKWKKLKAPTPPRKKRRIAVKPKGTPRPSAALRAAMQAHRTRPNQNTTPPVIQDSMKTPTHDQSSVVNSFLSCATQPRNSNSPYIVMRLSGMGRLSTMVGMDTSDQSTTCKNVMKSKDTSDATGVLESQNSKIKLEAKEIEEGEQDFGINSIFELQSNVSDATGVLESPNSTIKLEATEIEEGEQDFGINSMFELQSNVSEVTLLKTPRRSVRLLSKTPTPRAMSRLCGACLSPKSDSEDTLEESKEETKPFGKRFALRPSNLVVSERITFGTNPKGSRRSVRISNARKVTFDAGTEEKRSFKLPATPYRKSGVQQPHEDSNGDD